MTHDLPLQTDLPYRTSCPQIKQIGTDGSGRRTIAICPQITQIDADNHRKEESSHSHLRNGGER